MPMAMIDHCKAEMNKWRCRRWWCLTRGEDDGKWMDSHGDSKNSGDDFSSLICFCRSSCIFYIYVFFYIAVVWCGQFDLTVALLWSVCGPLWSIMVISHTGALQIMPCAVHRCSAAVSVKPTHLGCVAPTSFNFEPGSNLNLNLVQPWIVLHQSGSSVDFRSILNCHLTTDQILISVQLHGYACALGNKYFLWYYCCKKIVWFETYLVQKTSSYRIIRLLMQLHWWSGYVRFLLYLFCVLFVLDKLTNRSINRSFWWQCLAATVNIQSNPNHSNKNSFVSIYKMLNSIILVI